MSNTTAKLILLQQAEKLISAGRLRSIEPALIGQVKELRQEIPAEMLAGYDQLKAQNKMPVVAAIGGICQGCRSPLSQAAKTELEREETVCCLCCGCYLYSVEPQRTNSPNPGPLVATRRPTRRSGILHRL